MKAKKFDEIFDSGEDITEYLDIPSARRPGQEQKRVSLDCPVWMVNALDKEARRFGVPRQSLIKVLVARHLEKTGTGI